jgi:hypothetical protein
MIIALALFGYVFAMAAIGPAMLQRSSWPTRAPWLGLFAWLSAMGSTLTAVVVGGLSAITRLHVARSDAGGPLRVCIEEFRSAFASPGDAVITIIAALVVSTVAVRAVWGIATAVRLTRRQHRRQLQLLGLLARHDRDLGALVVDHPSATVYCLPGRIGRVVITSAALTALEPSQLAAVLAHERAHLRGRHHLLVAISSGLVRAFPGVPLFGLGDEQIRDLVEMAADDRACRRHSPSTLARALLALVDQSPPAAALAARGKGAEDRLRRLSVDRGRMSPVSYGAAGGLVTVIAGAPIVIATVIALIVVTVDLC